MMLKWKYTLIIIIITIISNFKVFAQHHISIYEFKWAAFHPFAALKIRYSLPKAMFMYKDVAQTRVLDTLANGGKLDAFRHAYAMAFLARKIKVQKLRKLGIAHEKGNKKQFKKHQTEDGERPDSLACEMDLRNNELGLLLGSGNKTLNDAALKLLVINAIKEGKAWYLKRNEHFMYVNCSNMPLEMRLYSQKWYVPKCLVKTNE